MDLGFDKRLMETVVISTTKENLLDEMWLFGCIPWGNHDNKNAKLIFDGINTLHYAKYNGGDTSTLEFKTLEFNNIIVYAFHGSAGNNYTFNFMLEEVKVGHLFEQSSFGFTKEELRARLNKRVEQKIKGLEYQMKIAKEHKEIIINL